MSNPIFVHEVPERLKPFDAPTPTRRSLLVSLVVGVLIAALVAIAGGYYLVRRSVQYSAEASIVILPDKSLESSVAIGAFDTLSQGQVTATFAEILRRQDLQKKVVHQLALSTAEGNGVSINVAVVANTSLISVDTTASTPTTAERVADAVVNSSTQYESALAIPYRSAIVASAAGTAKRAGTSTNTLIAAFAVVAIVAGFAAQQGMYQMLALRHRLSRRPGTGVVPAERYGRAVDELFGPKSTQAIQWRSANDPWPSSSGR